MSQLYTRTLSLSDLDALTISSIDEMLLIDISIDLVAALAGHRVSLGLSVGL